jgi:WD40 repeat protein
MMIKKLAVVALACLLVRPALGQQWSQVPAFENDDSVALDPGAVSTFVCEIDEDCDDGSACTEDFCTDGICFHEENDDVALGGGEMILVVGVESHSVERYHERSGNPLGAIADATSGLNLPLDAAYGPDGNLYVSNCGTDSVLRFHWPTGVLIDAFVASRSGGLDCPSGLLWGKDGNLYVASLGTNSVLKYDGNTGHFLGVFVASGDCDMGLEALVDMVWGPDGHLYVTCPRDDSVRRYHYPKGQPLGSFIPSRSGGLRFPFSLAWGPDGNLYVASAFTHNVLGYHYPSGLPIGSLVPAGTGGLNFPTSILFNAESVYVASHGTDSVKRYHWPTGIYVSSSIQPRSGGLDCPVSILKARAICDSKFIFRTLGKSRKMTRPTPP